MLSRIKFSAPKAIATAVCAAFLVPAITAPLAQDTGAVSVPVAEDRAALRCAAAFALAAGAEARGEPVPGYAGIGERGREYLVRTGARLTAAGWSRADVAAAMRDAAGQVAGQLPQLAPACNALLDTEVPPVQMASRARCVASLQIAAAATTGAEAERLRARAAKLGETLRRDEGAETADRAIAAAREGMLNGRAGSLPADCDGGGAAPGLELVKPD
ncbi:hypothetical protein [uncultured Croceicoccus sp.]|uniref:hypothetical protein n=1 Tax=uncultured Croceicoccus sp. TaxID=1295329 RepID=UPI002635877B|nr:hypothetical protein [uncultured Croceicoccus sp.]